MGICTQKSSNALPGLFASGILQSYTATVMPRNKKMRYCRKVEGYNLYKPSGIPLSQIEIIELGLDELEAMRLCDYDGMQQGEAADVMGVSRGTIQRLLEAGRRKTLDALVRGKALSFADAEHVCIDSNRPIRPGRHGRGFGHERGQ